MLGVFIDIWTLYNVYTLTGKLNAWKFYEGLSRGRKSVFWGHSGRKFLRNERKMPYVRKKPTKIGFIVIKFDSYAHSYKFSVKKGTILFKHSPFHLNKMPAFISSHAYFLVQVRLSSSLEKCTSTYSSHKKERFFVIAKVLH